jgi:hypothetical protein
LHEGELPVYEGAKIVRVRELPAFVHDADVPPATPVVGGTIRREGIGQVLGLR